jgi:hypothetical protein
MSGRIYAPHTVGCQKSRSDCKPLFPCDADPSFDTHKERAQQNRSCEHASDDRSRVRRRVVHMAQAHLTVRGLS